MANGKEAPLRTRVPACVPLLTSSTTGVPSASPPRSRKPAPRCWRPGGGGTGKRRARGRGLRHIDRRGRPRRGRQVGIRRIPVGPARRAEQRDAARHRGRQHQEPRASPATGRRTGHRRGRPASMVRSASRRTQAGPMPAICSTLYTMTPQVGPAGGQGGPAASGRAGGWPWPPRSGSGRRACPGCETRIATVRSLMNRARAICRLLSPVASRARTADSRSVRSSRADATARSGGAAAVPSRACAPSASASPTSGMAGSSRARARQLASARSACSRRPFLTPPPPREAGVRLPVGLASEVPGVGHAAPPGPGVGAVLPRLLRGGQRAERGHQGLPGPCRSVMARARPANPAAVCAQRR